METIKIILLVVGIFMIIIMTTQNRIRELFSLLKEQSGHYFQVFKGKATERLIIDGKEVLDKDKLPQIVKRTILIKPPEADIFSVEKGGFIRFIMNYKNRLFVDDIVRWLEKISEEPTEENQREVSSRLIDIVKLNPILFSGYASNLEQIFFRLSTLKRWTILKVPREMYPLRFINKVDYWVDRIAGYRFIAWFPWGGEIAVRRFTWNEVNDKKTDDNNSFKLRDEWTNRLLAKAVPYMIILTEIEDNSDVPLFIGLQVQLRCTDPYQALYELKDWLKTYESQVASTSTKIISRNSYIRTELKKDDKIKEVFVKAIESGVMDLNNNFFLNGLSCTEAIGMFCESIQVKQINPSDPEVAAEIRKSSLRVFDAQQRAMSTVLEAEAEMEAMKKRAVGEKAMAEALNTASPQTAEILKMRGLPPGLISLAMGKGSNGTKTMLNITPEKEGKE